jgi:SAM-dependent methyltransferase
MKYKRCKIEDLGKLIDDILSLCIARSQRESDEPVVFDEFYQLTTEQQKTYPNILELSSPLKSRSSSVPTVYTVSDFSPSLTDIKLHDLLGWIDGLGEVNYLLTFRFKDATKRHYLVQKEDKVLYKMLRTLHYSIPDQHLEPNRLVKSNRQTPNLFFKTVGWKPNWDINNLDHYYFYNDITDPMLVKAFEDYACKQPREMVVLDVGAGKGRLAMKLIQKAVQSGIDLYYICLEPGKEQCDIAIQVLEGMRQEMNGRFTFDVLNSTIGEFSTKYSERTAELMNQVDVIISSGGALNYQVVATGKDALSNLHVMRDLMRPGGVMLVTGLSSLLLTKKEMRAADMNFLNATFDKERREVYCYVYSKPESPELEADGPKGPASS